MLNFKTGHKTSKLLAAANVPKASYYRWKKAIPTKENKVIPKGHWLLDSEIESIIAFKKQHPDKGYRVLSYMMLDSGIVAVSPSSVFRVLKKAGLSSIWTQPEAEKHKTGFNQPSKPHTQWHTDISYLNILGTHYFFMAVLDGYSRYIVHHEIFQSMEVLQVEILVEKSLEKLPPDSTPPRIITDNGGQYISREFKDYLRDRSITHSRTRPNHPQSNGKIERFHKSLKTECTRVYPLSDLDEAKELIAEYVDEYNTKRLHSALNYLTPIDYLQGEEHVARKLKERKLKLAEAAEHRRKARALVVKSTKDSQVAQFATLQSAGAEYT